MKRDNRNVENPLRYFFTLLFFIGGLITYIIIKQKSQSKKDITVGEDKKLLKSGSHRDNVNEKEGVVEESLTERQKMIMTEVAQKGSIYPTDLAKLLPDVSTRTIRRDMTNLVELKLVKQEGSTKSTYYTYIKK